VEVLIVKIFHQFLLLLVFILCAGCVPDFNNPYDPENERPLPLAPTDISFTPTELHTLRIRFNYEYANHSIVKIKRGGRTIARLSSGNEIFDYWEFSEDTSMKYWFIGSNNFGETGEKVYFKNRIPPRIEIRSGLKDTVFTYKVVLNGTVWDSSDIDIFAIGEDTIPLYNKKDLKYQWEYRLYLKPGLNNPRIYAKDDSSIESDTTIEFSIYYAESSKRTEQHLMHNFFLPFFYIVIYPSYSPLPLYIFDNYFPLHFDKSYQYQ